MTESTIDMDRAMQGIDCEIITWTKCSERMPPDDAVIAKVGDDDTLFRVSGILVKQEYNRWKNFSDIPVFWTPYTPEAWAKLNKNIS